MRALSLGARVLSLGKLGAGQAQYYLDTVADGAEEYYVGGNPTARPTGRLILDALSRLRLIPATANAPPIVPAPTGLQARLLELLDVDPVTTR